MEPYIGEVRPFPYNRIPRGWAECNGQRLSVKQYNQLYTLIGTIYGGDGTQNFGVPDLRGRIVLHPQVSTMLGGTGGNNTSSISYNNMPKHNHTVMVTSTAANESGPAGNLISAQAEDTNYAPIGTNKPVAMAADAIGPFGPNVPVSNMQPTLGLTFCIALQGIYPSKG